ncbi:putative nuclease HARBI1 isoform X2 [Bactrocera dorsalis]|uniref:Nuclease HARBI1 isoform X2 n=1 Tax=Bactrocera dorsalis TaxID=27457 RepID=A0ABM3JTM6_BACDO|nr:putative nuclease HARBI1 isoform X2 [Bactrocera dorsalis]
MEEDILLLLLLEEEENLENRDRARYFRSLRDSTDPFALSESEFMKNFRLPRDICRSLIDDLRPHDQQKTSLPLTIRVLATLNFFGHGSYQKCVGNNCNLPMSQSSLSRSMRAVAKLIVKVKGEEIKFPSSTEEENIVRTGFFTKYGIKSTIGAIDCTHVAIIAPASNNIERPLGLYLNRKGFYSINVEAVCDHRLCFTFLNAKFPGATHDSGIWATSDLREHLIRQHTNDSVGHRRESWLIGDQGYPLEPWLLTPVGNPSTSQERKYNKLHCTARNCVERAFGVLKSRFRCLLKHRVLHYSHETSALIISSCVILHNIITKAGITMHAVDNEVEEDSDHVVNSGDSLQYTREGERIRARYISTL